MAVAAHQRQLPAVFSAGGIDLAPTGQEMVVDEPDDIETVGHDARVGKMLARQDAIRNVRARSAGFPSSHAAVAGHAGPRCAGGFRRV